MRFRHILASLLGLGLVLAGFGCGGSSHTVAVTPTPQAAPYVSTVTGLIKDKTLETNDPDSLASLDLSGADTEDEHAFDTVLTGH